MATVAQSIVRSLEEHGVDCCFGMPGAQLLELYDALADSRMNSVLATNESSAVFMADGYARASGKVGLCVAIAGPGLTNMATGLAEALTDSSPLVALTAGVPEDDKAFHIHQVDQVAAIRPLVKAVINLPSAFEASRRVGEAFGLAQSGEPGPVVLQVPSDLFRAGADYTKYAKEVAAGPDNSEAIAAIARMLLEAGRRGLYVGRGALAAAPLVREIAEKLGAPVATTVSGKGVLAEDHELSVGFGFGPSGSPLAQEVFGKCDVILAIGCKFSEMASSKWQMSVPGKLIHVDRCGSVLNANYPAAVSLCMDAQEFCAALLARLGAVSPRRDRELLELIAAEKAGRRDTASRLQASRGIHPARLLRAMRDALARETLLVTDCGNHQIWAISEYPVLEPGTFITPSDYQAMGFGVPAAVGAALARPDRRVVCLCGDGGFLMSGMELLTAVREKLNLAVVVCNDGALGLIKTLQQKAFARDSSVDLPPLDHKKFAESVGAGFLELNADQDLTAGLKQMAERPGVTVVNARVAYDDWPPFLEGMTKASWSRLSLGEKVALAARRAVRAVKYGR